MSPLYDLILQRKGELQTETMQVVDAVQVWRLECERYLHCIRGVVRRDAVGIAIVMALPNAAKTGHLNGLGWSCGSSRAR